MTTRMDDRDEYGNSRLHDHISTRPHTPATHDELLKLTPVVPWGYDPTNARRFT